MEEGLYNSYPCSENKGADQLCSYCTADLCLCLSIGKILFFFFFCFFFFMMLLIICSCFSLILLTKMFKRIVQNFDAIFYAPVSRDNAGLECQDLTSDESRQCRGFYFPANTRSRLFKLDINCILTFNYCYGHYLICKCICTFTRRNSGPSLIFHSHISVSSKQLPAVVLHYCQPPESRGF